MVDGIPCILSVISLNLQHGSEEFVTVRFVGEVHGIPATSLLDSIGQMTSSQMLTGTLGKEIVFFDTKLFIILGKIVFLSFLKQY